MSDAKKDHGLQPTPPDAVPAPSDGTYTGDIVDARRAARSDALEELGNNYLVSQLMIEGKRKIGLHAEASQKAVRVGAGYHLKEGLADLSAINREGKNTEDEGRLAQFIEKQKDGLATDLDKTASAVNRRTGEIAERDITPRTPVTQQSSPETVVLTAGERLRGVVVRSKNGNKG